ncbi:hypothetical protein AVEN_219102-1, partial [Araneus ventricosus]
GGDTITSSRCTQLPSVVSDTHNKRMNVVRKFGEESASSGVVLVI